jgi:sucrose phosphorylase
MELLNNPTTANAIIFHDLKKLIKIRRAQPAFHPDAVQITLHINHELFAFWRISRNQKQQILVVSNMTSEIQYLKLPEHPVPEGSGLWRNLIEQTALNQKTKEMQLYSYQSVWLEALN